MALRHVEWLYPFRKKETKMALGWSAELRKYGEETSLMDGEVKDWRAEAAAMRET